MRWLFWGQMAGVVAVGALLSVRAWVFDWYRVSTGSMFPTIQPGDVVLVRRESWLWRVVRAESTAPVRGRIVTIRLAKDSVPLVKRIAAIPKDTVSPDAHGVLVNGSSHPHRCRDSLARDDTTAKPDAVSSSVPSPAARTTAAPIVLAANDIFVLGDNAVASTDSRVFGPIPASAIIGEVKLVVRNGRIIPVC